jgi:transcriptional regulator with XRE-family HTH domain
MNNLKFLRTQSGLTTRRLATLLNVSSPLISNLENGKRGFSIEMINSLSSFFNVTTDFLLGKNGDGIFFSFIDDFVPESQANISVMRSDEYLSYKQKGLLVEKVIDGNCPQVIRTIKTNGENELSRTLKREEVISLLDGMSEDQLRKVITLIKEVILK